MAWTNLHATILREAFENVLGRAEAGSVAFVHCLTPMWCRPSCQYARLTGLRSAMLSCSTKTLTNTPFHCLPNKLARSLEPTLLISIYQTQT